VDRKYKPLFSEFGKLSKATNLDDLDTDTITNTFEHETLTDSTRVACVLCDSGGENCAPFPGGCQNFVLGCACSHS